MQVSFSIRFILVPSMPLLLLGDSAFACEQAADCTGALHRCNLKSQNNLSLVQHATGVPACMRGGMYVQSYVAMIGYQRPGKTAAASACRAASIGATGTAAGGASASGATGWASPGATGGASAGTTGWAASAEAGSMGKAAAGATSGA